MEGGRSMNVDIAALRSLIGTQALSDHLAAAVAELMADIGLPYSEACKRVTENAEAGDPNVIAATRQTWVRTPDADTEQMPVRRLYVLERNRRTVVVAFLDVDQDGDADDAGENSRIGPLQAHANDHSAGTEIGVEILSWFFELEKWEPFEHLLPTCDRPAKAEPQGPPS
ncbi:hypothetical protein ACFV3E_36600 [Streptomyces sp. NPDC059718]